MFLLDTNVLSELMRATPATQVVAWLDQQNAIQLCTSAITRAEIELGIAKLPHGAKRDHLAAQAKQMFEYDFAQTCMAFDSTAAATYAAIVTQRTQAGQPISREDAQIASIAITRQCTLVTRNIKDFEGRPA